VQIAAGDIGLSTPDVETAVYLWCLESIQNAAKHAGSGASVTVRLRREGTDLAFLVHDTGHGFDPRLTGRGAGLTGLNDRIETVGGRARSWQRQAVARPWSASSHGRRAPRSSPRSSRLGGALQEAAAARANFPVRQNEQHARRPRLAPALDRVCRG